MCVRVHARGRGRGGGAHACACVACLHACMPACMFCACMWVLKIGYILNAMVYHHFPY